MCEGCESASVVHERTSPDHGIACRVRETLLVEAVEALTEILRVVEAEIRAVQAVKVLAEARRVRIEVVLVLVEAVTV